MMIDKGIEYTSLRAEITARIEQRHHILLVSLAIAGAFIGFGAKEGQHFAVTLAYPPIAFLLCLTLAQNVARTWNLATYIRKEIETSGNGLRWEHYMEEVRNEKRGAWEPAYRWWRARLLVGGRNSAWLYGLVFIITQITAICIGMDRFSNPITANPPSPHSRADMIIYVALLVASFLAVFGVGFVMPLPVGRHRERLHRFLFAYDDKGAAGASWKSIMKEMDHDPTRQEWLKSLAEVMGWIEHIEGDDYRITEKGKNRCKCLRDGLERSYWASLLQFWFWQYLFQPPFWRLWFRRRLARWLRKHSSHTAEQDQE